MNTEKFNVGDRILVRDNYGWHGSRHTPGTVTKKTPSGITTVFVDAFLPHGTIAYEKKFKPSGWQMGTANYRGSSLEEFSQTIVDNERYQSRVAAARRFVQDEDMWRKLDDETVLRIAALVKAELAPKESA